METITKNLNDKAPVYHQYSIQNQPQPAFIELDCRGEGELMADYSGEIDNGVPMYYWHGLAVRWDIPSDTMGRSISDLFKSQAFISCCKRILDGFEEVWDGSNYVGRYSDDSVRAVEEAEVMIQRDLEQCEVWDVNDWLFNSCKLSDHWCDESIEDAVAKLEACLEYNHVVDGDFEDALIEKAKEELEYHPERLNRNHIKTLWTRGEIKYSQVREWVRETK